MKAIIIDKTNLPETIDEISILAVVATQMNGYLIVKDAEELRHKECDRIKAIVSQLSLMGAWIKETKDGFIVKGFKTKSEADD